MISDELRKYYEMLPDLPGVYKYFDKTDTVIYVGKAKNLKKRVGSYFNKQQYENRKTAVLVKNISRIDFTVVDSEMDALLLENGLIKEYKPKYNINLKDDKSYPYIRITNDVFPKVYAMRNPVNDGSSYYGPYTSASVLRIILDLIKQLYPIRNCNLPLTKKNIELGKFSACLEYQIGNCNAPCIGEQSEQDYAESIKQIKHLLTGHLSEVKKHLKEQMQQAAENMHYEQAQKFKEKLLMLDNYQHKSTIVSHTVGNISVFAISSTEKSAFVNHMKVSNGIIVSTHNVELKKRMDETDAELLEYAIAELHNPQQYKELVLPFEIELEIAGNTITVPKAGDKRRVLELSLKNALYFKKEKLNQYDKLDPQHKVDRLMSTMQADLKMKVAPVHIECFDNSNLQGTNAVSACVVFKNGKPSKADYRIFNVKTVVGPDDFATMEEVLTRRYSRLINEEQKLPELIIIDGGKGQLSSAVSVLKKLELYGKITVIGIAKRLEEIYYPGDSLPMYIDKKSETLKVIQHLRDEAHRFGITNHRKRRLSSSLKTELTQIPGIGAELSRLLLKEFKGITQIKNASLDSLTQVIGGAKAKKVFEYFNTKNG